ncbi:hypothetical protein OSB04_025403 [Centaurea solstitialis]|uniref:Reverse transcriptase domain-containing protein n=1 Tax=Centaurea solstitialis TaxID=347529 RepID=A0AA38SZM4_9ASTR|nr:hypothetical protein OSB04_025403 [Centaurea solstitialis]
MSADDSKLSKLDRFLVTSNLLSLSGLPQVFKFFRSYTLTIRLCSSGLFPKTSAQLTSIHCGCLLGQCYPLRIFMDKLKSLKLNIKAWRANVLSAKKGNLDTIKKKLEDLDRKAELSALSTSERYLRQDYLIGIKDLEKANHLDLRQRARLKWAFEGDENSRLFQGVINSNRRNSFIHGLSLNGCWIFDPSTNKQGAVNFFANKFSCSNGMRYAFVSNKFSKLSQEQDDFLEFPFSELEIKSAVWDCGFEKAPGPDAFLETLKGDLIATVRHFEASATLDKGCNPSFIALISKVDSPLPFSDFRPISLLGCLYKVIVKILTNQLKQIVNSIIGPKKTAFIHGRSILGGPLIASEILSWAKKNQKKPFLFKTDFNKASVSVNWDFLVLILINGSSTFEFCIGKGLRQGDPLALFLFIIAAEALKIAMKEARDIGVYRGVNLPNEGPLISHLHQLLAVGVDQSELESVARNFHCKPGSFPIKYLGLPLGCLQIKGEA